MTNESISVQKMTPSFSRYVGAEGFLQDIVSPVAHPMNQGVDGLCAKVIANDKTPMFFKSINQDQLRWVGFENAVAMAKQAGEAGISPKLIAADRQNTSFLFEHLGQDWRPAIVLDLRVADTRNNLVSALKRLHSLPPLPQDKPVQDRIADMQQEMEKGTRHVVTGALAQISPPENYDIMRKAVAKITAAFSAAGSETAPCHVENSLSNFMLGPSGCVKIVDFDRAANADPLSDIAALCNEYYRTDEDVAQTVEFYTGGTATDIIARVKLHMILSAFYWGMWGKVSQFCTDRSEIEYYKYGENQFVRCGYHIANWDIDQLIKEM